MIDGELIKITLYVPPYQDDYLKSLNQNKSVAIRTIIDNIINNKENIEKETKRLKIQRSLLYLVFLITLCTLLLMLFF